MNIRKLLFDFLDSLRGGKYQSNLKNIANINNLWPEPSVMKERSTYLDEILSYTKLKVPYYKGMNLEKLSDFPVVNKNIVRENQQVFLSIDYTLDQLSVSTTSGSTGTPFKVYKDIRKVQRHKADVMFFNQLANCEIGDKIYYFRVWNSQNKKSKVSAYKENIVMVDTANLSDDNLEKIINEICNDKTPKVFLGFASSFEILAKYLKGKKIEAKVKSIITMSEALSDSARKELKKIFNCKVVSRYSNTENGLVSMQLDSSRYYLNLASYYFEILSLTEDKPVEYGVEGRIVITDLFNHGMPLIRYDTGDVGVMDIIDGRPYLTKVSGRKSDFIFATDGSLLSNHGISILMWKYDNLLQYQFVQNGEKDYVMKLTMKTKSNSYIKGIESDLHNYVGNDANIKIEIVNEIPLLNSGKRKYIVNNYKCI